MYHGLTAVPSGAASVGSPDTIAPGGAGRERDHGRRPAGYAATPGEGSPENPVPRARPRPGEARGTARFGATVLLADGDDQRAGLLRFALERGGLAVDIAATGRDALSRVRAGRLDLLILDAGLPDMDALTALAKVRSFSQLPIIMTAPGSADDDILAGLRAGADDYVVRPYSVQILVLRVHAVLRRARPGQAARQEIPAAAEVYEIDGAVFDSGTNEVRARPARPIDARREPHPAPPGDQSRPGPRA